MPSRLPDAGEALRLFLLSRSKVTAYTGQRIGISLAGAGVSIRYATAGGQGGYSEATPLMLVECWGAGGQAPDDGAAGNLARTVVDEIEAFRGVWAGGWVPGASVDGWPADSPDQETKRPRQVLTVRMSIYPLEDT